MLFSVRFVLLRLCVCGYGGFGFRCGGDGLPGSLCGPCFLNGGRSGAFGDFPGGVYSFDRLNCYNLRFRFRCGRILLYIVRPCGVDL